MKLLFSNDWLRKKIASDPDLETEAGNLDTGEQYEVSFYDETTGGRRVHGRTNDLDQARIWADALDRQKLFPQLTDRTVLGSVRHD